MRNDSIVIPACAEDDVLELTRTAPPNATPPHQNRCLQCAVALQVTGLYCPTLGALSTPDIVALYAAKTERPLCLKKTYLPPAQIQVPLCP